MDLSIFPTWSLAGFAILVSTGIFIFLFSVGKSIKKHRAIKHYEKIRDKLTVREAQEETGVTKDEYESYSGLKVGNIIGAFVTLLVGVSLINPILEQLDIAVQQGKISGLGLTFINLVPIIFAVAILLPIIAILWTSLFGKRGEKNI